MLQKPEGMDRCNIRSAPSALEALQKVRIWTYAANEELQLGLFCFSNDLEKK